MYASLPCVPKCPATIQSESASIKASMASWNFLALKRVTVVGSITRYSLLLWVASMNIFAISLAIIFLPVNFANSEYANLANVALILWWAGPSI